MTTRTQSNVFIRLDDLVAINHPYRHFDRLRTYTGCYLTRDLILGYMAAFHAGDTDSRIAS